VITLSFGFQLPETGDTGPIVFPALEDNIQQLNDHTHDGVTSSKLNSGAINPLSISLASAAWALVANGIYKQTVTLPGALSYDTTSFTVKLETSEDLVYPTIEKVSASQYDIFTNDNSLGFEVKYL